MELGGGVEAESELGHLLGLQSVGTDDFVAAPIDDVEVMAN